MGPFLALLIAWANVHAQAPDEPPAGGNEQNVWPVERAQNPVDTPATKKTTVAPSPTQTPWLPVLATAGITGVLLVAGMAAAGVASLGILPVFGLYATIVGVAGGLVGWWLSGQFGQRVPMVPLIAATTLATLAGALAGGGFHAMACLVVSCTVVDLNLGPEVSRYWMMAAVIPVEMMCVFGTGMGAVLGTAMVAVVVASTGRAYQPGESGPSLDLFEVDDEVAPTPAPAPEVRERDRAPSEEKRRHRLKPRKRHKRPRPPPTDEDDSNWPARPDDAPAEPHDDSDTVY